MSGFLGDAFKGVSGGMKEGEAFLTILIGAVMADGQITEEEDRELEALVIRSKTLREFKKSDSDGFSRVRSETPQKMRVHDDLLRLVEEAASSLVTRSDGKEKPIARSVFMHAADIIFADSKIPEREQIYLEKLAVKLKLDQNEALSIVNFIREKNEY